jgi:hypothetical protein
MVMDPNERFFTIIKNLLSSLLGCIVNIRKVPEKSGIGT